jgi:hypothetical protein
MQPPVATCGVCGARMPGSAGPAGGAADEFSRREGARLAIALVALLIGVVACGVLALALLYAVL